MALALVLCFAVVASVIMSRSEARNTEAALVLAPDSPAFSTVRGFIQGFVAGDGFQRYLSPGMTMSGSWSPVTRRSYVYVKGLGVPPVLSGAPVILSDLRLEPAPGFTVPAGGRIRVLPVAAYYRLDIWAPNASGRKALMVEDRYMVGYVRWARTWKVTSIQRIKEEPIPDGESSR